MARYTKQDLLKLLGRVYYNHSYAISVPLQKEIEKALKSSNIITNRQAEKLLNDHKRNDKKNTIFRVEFIKRTDGSLRVMRARYNVKSHLKGGKLAFSPDEKHLSIVWDVDKKEYRSINLDKILKLRIGGKTYVVS